MTKFKKIIGIGIIISVGLLAQTSERFSTAAVDINPVPIPSVPTTVFSSTIYLQEMTLTNINTVDIFCSITDKQTPPRALYSNVVSPGILVFAFKGRKMPGGVIWSCSDSTSINGYMQGIK